MSGSGDEFFEVAVEDYKFMSYAAMSRCYNNLVVVAEHAVRNFLLSVLAHEQSMPLGEIVFATVNEIVDKIPASAEIQLNREELQLVDSYRAANNPGFPRLTEDECLVCLNVMFTVVDKVATWRYKKGFTNDMLNQVISSAPPLYINLGALRNTSFISACFS